MMSSSEKQHDQEFVARLPFVDAGDQPNVLPARSEGKSKSQPAKKSKNGVGSERAIETMFRCAYRTQLDLTALAATKANIMISLNGFILSVLTLAGPFVLFSQPVLIVPLGVFLCTCLASIIFAVLAARPRNMQNESTPGDFRKGRANILAFEQFSRLNEAQHLKLMKGLLRDNDLIYESMTRQIYHLGISADHKFCYLAKSYNVFLIGLSLTSLVLVGVGLYLSPHLASIAPPDISVTK